MNRALRFHYVTYLVPAPDGVSLDHKHEGDPVEGALARLAESVARELTQGRPERLRVCENEECRWIFLDTSHSGKRKWCDMRTCGNRVKVARHRQRRREEGQADDADAGLLDAACWTRRRADRHDPRASARSPVTVEAVDRKVFASALDWPGWSRSGKTEALALEALAGHAARYAVIARRAGADVPGSRAPSMTSTSSSVSTAMPAPRSVSLRA